jgi:hypothetical protein
LQCFVSPRHLNFCQNAKCRRRRWHAPSWGCPHGSGQRPRSRGQLSDGFLVRRWPGPRRDGGHALREVLYRRPCSLHSRLPRHDHPQILGLRLRQLSAARRWWVIFFFALVMREPATFAKTTFKLDVLAWARSQPYDCNLDAMISRLPIDKYYNVNFPVPVCNFYRCSLPSMYVLNYASWVIGCCQLVIGIGRGASSDLPR